MRRKEHELKGMLYYSKNDLVNAYQEFLQAGREHVLSQNSKAAFIACLEHNEFSQLGSNSNENDLSNFLIRYPNSIHGSQISNWIAISKAKVFNMFTEEAEYNQALSYAKDAPTRNEVKAYYEAQRKEFSRYQKEQRRLKRKENGGIINFGLEVMDLALNPTEYSDKAKMEPHKTVSYNLGLGVKLGNYKSLVQLDLGIKFGITSSVLLQDDESEFEIKKKQLPLYARLKIGLGGSSNSKWYVDGVGYYNLIKKTAFDSDYSASAGIGVSWRHWDWRILYYKQDIEPKLRYSNDHKFLGTSFIYYF